MTTPFRRITDNKRSWPSARGIVLIEAPHDYGWRLLPARYVRECCQRGLHRRLRWLPVPVSRFAGAVRDGGQGIGLDAMIVRDWPHLLPLGARA